MQEFYCKVQHRPRRAPGPDSPPGTLGSTRRAGHSASRQTLCSSRNLRCPDVLSPVWNRGPKPVTGWNNPLEWTVFHTAFLVSTAHWRGALGKESYGPGSSRLTWLSQSWVSRERSGEPADGESAQAGGTGGRRRVRMTSVGTGLSKVPGTRGRRVSNVCEHGLLCLRDAVCAASLHYAGTCGPPHSSAQPGNFISTKTNRLCSHLCPVPLPHRRGSKVMVSTSRS